MITVTGIELKLQNIMMNEPMEEIPDDAMLTALAEAPQVPPFYKPTGPKSIIDYWRESFNNFVKSFKFEEYLIKF